MKDVHLPTQIRYGDQAYCTSIRSIDNYLLGVRTRFRLKADAWSIFLKSERNNECISHLLHEPDPNHRGTRVHGSTTTIMAEIPPSPLPQVFGWDTSTNSYQTSASGGRSYISAISEVITDTSETCDGRAKNDMGEARLDIEDSEVAYLGYYNSESYGLSWKVIRTGREGGWLEGTRS